MGFAFCSCYSKVKIKIASKSQLILEQRKYLLLIITNYLNLNEKLRLSLVNKKISSYLKENLKVKISFKDKIESSYNDIFKVINIKNKILEINKRKTIESLDYYTKSEDLNFLEKIPTLKELNLKYGIEMDSKHICFKFLKSLKLLQKLRLKQDNRCLFRPIFSKFPEEAEQIKELYLDNFRSSFNLKLITNFVNLEKLHLDVGEIVNNDLSPLNALRKLKELKINCCIHTYTFIDLINLEKLYLDGYINNIKILDKNKKLKELSIYIKEENIDFISNFKELEKLKLSTTKDYFCANCLKENYSIKELELYKCNVKSIKIFKTLEKITLIDSHIEFHDFEEKANIKTFKIIKNFNFDISSNDFNFMKNLTRLEEIEIKDVNLNNIDPNEFNFITRLEILKKLNFTLKEKYCFDNLRFLEGKNDLIELILKNVKFNNIECINSIGKLLNLKKLELIDCNIKKIDFLISLKDLKKINLSMNKNILDFSLISTLKNPETLILSECNLKNIYFLNNLKSLKELNLASNNNISSFSPINEALVNLEKINLSGCHLKDINFLKNIKSLKELNLYWNWGLSNISPIKNMYLTYLCVDCTDVNPSYIMF